MHIHYQTAVSAPRSGRGVRVAVRAMAAAMALCCAPAFADVMTVGQLEGWVNSRGSSNEAAPMNNTFTGNENGMRYNSYAAFYIPPGSYTSASLSITPSFFGTPGADVIGLFDVSTPLSAFLNTFTPGKQVFDDLGSGRQYAAATLYDQPMTIKLNGRALADINAANGAWFLIGFTNQTLNAKPSGAGSDGIYISGVGRHQTPMQLNLGSVDGKLADANEVPEPSSLMSMAAGFVALGSMQRRRKQTAQRRA